MLRSPLGMSVSSSNPSRTRWLRGVLEVALAIAGLFGVRAYQVRGAAQGAAPSWSAPTIEGERVSLAQLRGAPFALHFWASWCGVCSAMRHNVRAFARDHRVISLVTVASESGDAAAIRRFVAQHPVDAPVLADADGALARAYGVRAFPTTFFIDANGGIRHVESGYTTELGMALRLWSAGL